MSEIEIKIHILAFFQVLGLGCMELFCVRDKFLSGNRCPVALAHWAGMQEMVARI